MCKMTINFFLKVLDKMLDLCYTNNVEKGSGKSLLADEGNRKTSVKVQLWVPNKCSETLRLASGRECKACAKAVAIAKPCTINSRIHRGESVLRGSVQPLFFYSPRRLPARRRDFRILGTLHKFETKSLCNLPIDFFRKECYTYYRK